MTREEAIERLMDFGSIIVSKNEEDKKYCQAIKMAIEALEQPKCLEGSNRLLNEIITEIEKNINEMKNGGKHHADWIKRNGDMICFGLSLALDIVKEKINE